MELLANVISLASRTDRRRRMSVSLSNRKIPYRFFDAIVWNWSYKGYTSKVAYRNRVLFPKNIPSAKTGCFLSHYELIMGAYERGEEGILIMEDDVYTMRIDAKELIMDGIENLPYGALTLQFEYIPYNLSKIQLVDYRYYRAFKNSVWGLGCYYVTRLGLIHYKNMIDKIGNRNLYKGADFCINEYFYPTNNCYLYKNKLCYQDQSSPTSMPIHRTNMNDKLKENTLKMVQYNFKYS
jgi:GR25 family glycosyltransferase involved in LPS biosynthesis